MVVASTLIDSLQDLLLQHETLDVLSACIIIKLHCFLDLLEGQFFLLVEHHQDAHLVSAKD